MKSSRGFTIVELLVVLVVIAILAAITLVSYNNIQNRARAAALTSELTNMEKAFRIMLTSDGKSVWPLQTEYNDPVVQGTTYPPRVGWIADNTSLGEYVSGSSAIFNDPNGYFSYANLGNDDVDACDDGYKGPMFVVKVDNKKIAEYVDSSLDNGNTECGKVRYLDGVNLVYQLGWSQSIE